MAIPTSETKREEAPTNPYGANQFMMDPRQKLCWENYVNPKSETFGNATQSAIKAGYEPDYADQITVTGWFKDKVRRLNMLSKAEKVLDEALEIIPLDELGNPDSALHRVKLDAAKFIASTQGKDEGYSTRTENTGPNGGPQEHVVLSGENDDLVKEYEAKLRGRITK